MVSTVSDTNMFRTGPVPRLAYQPCRIHRRTGLTSVADIVLHIARLTLELVNRLDRVKIVTLAGPATAPAASGVLPRWLGWTSIALRILSHLGRIDA